jgi:hypothetical protein
MRHLSMSDIMKAVAMRGGHWFDRDTLRFFRSRVSSRVYQGFGGVYFVSSERGPSGKRRYSVRSFDQSTASIETAGEFQQFGTAAPAHREAARLAKEGK